MKYRVSWQDVFCRFNIWHRYTDWQYDGRTVQKDTTIFLIQSRFCFNCHWRKIRRTEWPKNILRAEQ